MSLELASVTPELFLFVAGLVLLLVGSFRDEEPARLLTPLAALALLVAALIVVGQDTEAVTAFGGHFIFDGYAAFLKVLILLGGAVTIALAPGFMRDQRIDRFEYPLLALFAALGMCMMVSANSLLSLYMALELQSLSLYVMAAIHRDNVKSTEAGLKYFLLGALASGILLYGCSLIYGFTGTIFFTDLAARLTPLEPGAAPPLGVLVGLVFLVAGLAFKLAAVPFHMWTPDVYEGAPSPVTAYIAAAPKVAAVGLTVRVLMDPFIDWVPQSQQIVIAIAALSIALGSFAAIGQTNIKRLMAYSSIANIGYALIGLAAGTVNGVNGVLVYMAIYLLMTIGTFGCILLMRRQGRYVETFADLAGLSRRQPLLALALTIFMFSLAGIPPAAGFFAKLYVFWAAIDAGLAWLAVYAVIISVVGAYYYLRIVKIMYFDEPAEPFDRAPHMTPGLIAGVCAVLTLFFFAYPAPLLATAQAAAQSLLQ